MRLILRAETDLNPPNNFGDFPVVINQGDDAMHVVGHHHEGVQLYARVTFWEIMPGPVHNPACIEQNHLVVEDLPEYTFPSNRYNGDKVCTGLGVIIASQTD